MNLDMRIEQSESYTYTAITCKLQRLLVCPGFEPVLSTSSQTLYSTSPQIFKASAVGCGLVHSHQIITPFAVVLTIHSTRPEVVLQDSLCNLLLKHKYTAGRRHRPALMMMKPGGAACQGFVMSAHVMSFNEHCILENRTSVRIFMH